MSGNLVFYEVHRAYNLGRCFLICADSNAFPVAALEFYPSLRCWQLTPYRAYVRAQHPIMEVEGTNDYPPIDLALATLSLMGY